MATRKLGDVAVGEIVKLNENGSPVEYIVVHQGKPSSIYSESCDGTWLLRRESAAQRAWNSSDNTSYEKSSIHSWLNNTMIARFSLDIQNAIQQVKIPYLKNGNTDDKTSQTGESGLSCKVFLLSGYEVGFTNRSATSGGVIVDFPDDGSKLDYFISGLTTSANNRRKIYGENSISSFWVLRTQEIDLPCSIVRVEADGSMGTQSPSLSDYRIRPCVIVSVDADVSYDNLVTANQSPNVPSSITVPETIRGGEDTSIIWSDATDPDGNLDGYIVECSYNGGKSWTQIYQGRSTSTTTTIPFGTQTVMFRVCAYDTYGEKSGWRTSENRTVVNNRAPAAPPSISVPLSPAGGESLTVTWTASTDADGNLEGYELERQWDGAGAFTQIYKGAALSYQDSIPKGEHTSVVYRVRAYDSFTSYSSYTTSPSRTIDNNTAPVILSYQDSIPKGEHTSVVYRVRAYDSFTSYSSYTTSPSRTIDNNTAPVIACDLSGDLGEKSEGFSIQYTIKDAEKQEVTVIEKVGDLVKRTYQATLDSPNTFEITGEYFQKILNGAQTVQIVTTDSAGKSSTLSLTFTKAVHKAVITLSEPLAVEEPITVAVLAITGKIPADATQLIELTNNGNDPEPVWEDATADVKAGRNHPFTNKTQTNGWAFNFRVTVERGESGEDGNIVSIQGGFQ